MTAKVGKTALRVWATAAFLVILTFVAVVTSGWNDSPSWDEPEHIAAGYSYVRNGHFFYNPYHPPLTKDLAGLAVLRLVPPEGVQEWPTWPKMDLVNELFSKADPQTLVRVARLPLAGLAAVFVGFFFLCLRERNGYSAALFSALLLISTPLFLAHAGLVHNDVAAAGFIFLSLWLLAGYLARPPSWRSVLPFALAAAAAQVVKFSCLINYPVNLLAISWPKDRGRRWLHAPLVALAAILLVWAVYAVHPASHRYQKFYRETLLPAGGPPGWKQLDAVSSHPWAEPFAWYATGVLAQGKHVDEGHDYPVFLSGRLYPEGTSLYFPVLVLVKTPLAIWLLLGLSIPWWRRVWDNETKLFLLFIAIYLAVAVGSSLNIGLRHLLPIFPLLYAVVGKALASGLEQAKQRWYRMAVGVGLASALATALLAWPGYLPYFNILSPHTPAVDSDYDWGMDLYRLAERAQERGWSPMTIHYFGYIEPHHYLGSQAQRLDPANLPKSGWVAISATHYLPMKAKVESGGDDPLWLWLRRLEEVEQVGAIKVFRIIDERD